ncbi:hypothetical protein [Fulvivirga lutea]|uniref:Uncharacterized protein n=1 Tax=Fulvivirga lutea TaxID=2810512 RepID=A0A975A292_9BACT|nr:hypothetical protein [Fulvivirga lutea]QSE99201.1 hypothetical protein JR347_08960 [Fulvivirga lutea]
MKRYKIEIFKSFEKATIYTIHEQNAEYSETDDFLIRFKDNPDHNEDIQTIKYWITKIGSTGVLERHFRPENDAVAIPLGRSGLRLYGFRITNEILILGNGGKKTSQLVKDSPDAYPHFQLMNSVAYIINLKIQKEEITMNGSDLNGDLTFFVK